MTLGQQTLGAHTLRSEQERHTHRLSAAINYSEPSRNGTSSLYEGRGNQ